MGRNVKNVDGNELRLCLLLRQVSWYWGREQNCYLDVGCRMSYVYCFPSQDRFEYEFSYKLMEESMKQGSFDVGWKGFIKYRLIFIFVLSTNSTSPLLRTVLSRRLVFFYVPKFDNRSGNTGIQLNPV